MHVVKREEDGRLAENIKSSLTIIFGDSESALFWRQSIEAHVIPGSPVDRFAHALGYSALYDRKMTLKSLSSVGSMNYSSGVSPRSLSSAGAGTGAGFDDWLPGSILGQLVIPTSGAKTRETEALKVEIAVTFSQQRTL